MASGRSMRLRVSNDVEGRATDTVPVVPGTSCILFASSAERPAPYCLVHALEIADRRGASLLMLRVLPRRSLLAALLAPFLQNDDMRQMASFLGAARAASHWFATVLGERFNDEQVLVTIGAFEEEVAIQARMLNACMIVIPAGEWPGSTITALACAVRLPVLVVREVDTRSRHAEEARTCAADTIVVGAKPCSGMTEAVRSRVAAQAVNLARGSVLVVPIDLPL